MNYFARAEHSADFTLKNLAKTFLYEGKCQVASRYLSLRIMHRYIVASSLFAVSLPLSPALLRVTQAQSPLAKLTQVQQKVEVSSGTGGTFRAVKANAIIGRGDVVRTGRRSKADVKFSDGSLVRLGQLSSIEVRGPRNVQVGSGRALISWLSPGRIGTSYAAAEIKGTIVNIDVTDEGTTFTLYEGATEIVTTTGNRQALKPGTEVFARPDGTLSGLRTAAPIFFAQAGSPIELLDAPKTGAFVGSVADVQVKSSPARVVQRETIRQTKTTEQTPSFQPGQPSTPPIAAGPTTPAPTNPTTPAPTPAPTNPTTPAPTNPAPVTPPNPAPVTPPTTPAPTNPTTPPTTPAPPTPNPPTPNPPTPNPPTPNPPAPNPTTPPTNPTTPPAPNPPTSPAPTNPTTPTTPAPPNPPTTPAPTTPAPTNPTNPPTTPAPTNPTNPPIIPAPTNPTNPPTTPAPTNPAPTTPTPTNPTTPTTPTTPAPTTPTTPTTPAPTNPTTPAPTNPNPPTNPTPPAPTPTTPPPTGGEGDGNGGKGPKNPKDDKPKDDKPKDDKPKDDKPKDDKPKDDKPKDDKPKDDKPKDDKGAGGKNDKTFGGPTQNALARTFDGNAARISHVAAVANALTVNSFDANTVSGRVNLSIPLGSAPKPPVAARSMEVQLTPVPGATADPNALDVARAANDLGFDSTRAQQRLDELSGAGGRSSGFDARAIGVLGDGGNTAYGARIRGYVARGNFLLDGAVQPLKARVGKQNFDLSAVSDLSLTYRTPKIELQAGRQRFLSGPTQATLYGSLVRQGGREVMDAVRASKTFGSAREQRLDLAYLVDAYPRNLPFRVKGLQQGFLARYNVQKKANIGLNAIKYFDLNRSNQLGVSLDAAVPVGRSGVDLYGEFGRDTYGRNLSSVGLAFPGFYARTGLDVYLEAAYVGSSNNAARPPAEFALRVYRRVSDNVDLVGSLSRFSDGNTSALIGLSIGSKRSR